MSGTDGLSIDIIGGGASATLVLAQLALQADPGKIRQLTVYDRERRFGRGVAYSTQNRLHLLNVRANNMSAFPGDMTHLVRWLLEEGHGYRDTDFIPRMVYAQYLKNIWDEALQILGEKGCSVVTKMENMTLQASNADIAVVATGNAFPHAPAGAENLAQADGYYAHPWNIDYQSIKGDVVIPGTGLSMIDTVMALEGAGFEGMITAISRNGLIPCVHTDPASYPAYYKDSYPATVRRLLADLRLQVKKAAAQDVPWQAVVDSLRPVTNHIWLGLPDSEKKKMKRVMPFWNVHRHRMAPEANAVIQRLVSNGTLRIVKDNVIRIDRGLSVRGRKNTYKAGCVINCLGYGRDPEFVYDEKARESGVFAIGPALSGVYFETVAMPEIRVQAEKIVNEIMRR